MCGLEVGNRQVQGFGGVAWRAPGARVRWAGGWAQQQTARCKGLRGLRGGRSNCRLQTTATRVLRCLSPSHWHTIRPVWAASCSAPAVAVTLSPSHYHCHTTTVTPSHYQSLCHTTTVTLSHYHCNTVTQSLSHCHPVTLPLSPTTGTLSHYHCHTIIVTLSQ